MLVERHPGIAKGQDRAFKGWINSDRIVAVAKLVLNGPNFSGGADQLSTRQSPERAILFRLRAGGHLQPRQIERFNAGSRGCLRRSAYGSRRGILLFLRHRVPFRRIRQPFLNYSEVHCNASLQDRE
ncbi:hypothetical protein IL54_0268 [Sphingobium sp. ba1]|nr:hypothetical protein IL54_0268 [Sphingobium sp. ba1]